MNLMHSLNYAEKSMQKQKMISITLVDFHEEYFAEAYDMLAKYLNDYGQS